MLVVPPKISNKHKICSLLSLLTKANRLSLLTKSFPDRSSKAVQSQFSVWRFAATPPSLQRSIKMVVLIITVNLLTSSSIRTKRKFDKLFLFTYLRRFFPSSCTSLERKRIRSIIRLAFNCSSIPF